MVFLIVVVSSLGGDDSTTDRKTSPTQSTKSGRQKERTGVAGSTGSTGSTGPTLATNQKFYVVRAGDTLSKIAAKTGVEIEELLTLNPSVDPQGLVTGQKIKLRE
jgi:LysM repeat protein